MFCGKTHYMPLTEEITVSLNIAYQCATENNLIFLETNKLQLPICFVINVY